jgi:heat shock protein HspQ
MSNNLTEWRNNMKESLFNIGQMVKHKTQGYAAVIVDVDLIFQPSGQPNPRVNPDKMEKQGPWYRLLVHESSLVTYVAESELEQAFMQTPIHHPKLMDYLKLNSGHFVPKNIIH